MIVVVAIVAACKGDRTFRIDSKVHRHTTKTTGRSVQAAGKVADGKPQVTIAGVTGPLAEGLKKKLESAPPANRGAINVEVRELEPKSPDDDGTLKSTLAVTALFVHSPKMTKLEGTLEITLDYKNASTELLGEELGRVINEWFASEKLPPNLGPSGGPLPKVTRVAVGSPSCTLHDDGSVRCWYHDDATGMLVPEAGNSIAVDAATNFGACGVRKDGSAWCIDAWNNVVDLEVRDVCGVSGAKDISVGQSTGCALLADGHVRCWPRDASSFAPCGGAKPYDVEGIHDALAISVHAFMGCALGKDSSVKCWTQASDGKGNFKAAPIKELAKARLLVTHFTPCAVIGPSKVKCAKHEDVPGKEFTVPEPIQQITGGHMLCSLSEKGNVFCGWGELTPAKVDGVSDVVQIDGDLDGTCGVTSKGEVTCWGGMDGQAPPKKIELLP